MRRSWASQAGRPAPSLNWPWDLPSPRLGVLMGSMGVIMVGTLWGCHEDVWQRHPRKLLAMPGNGVQEPSAAMASDSSVWDTEVSALVLCQEPVRPGSGSLSSTPKGESSSSEPDSQGEAPSSATPSFVELCLSDITVLCLSFPISQLCLINMLASF